VRVTRTLHAAGNGRHLHHLAQHPAVDAIEADVWLRGRRLVAHHERPLGRLPLALEAGRLRPPVVNPVEFEELLAAVEGGATLVLDLRSWFADPAPEVASLLLRLPQIEHIAVTCEAWGVADRLRAWMPELRVAYSIRYERQLRQYIHGRIDGSIGETAVVVRHSLLHHPGEVEALRQRSSRVGAWTVDDVDRALELASWGVDEITSNSLSVLAAL
jgi:glycerophosphoryl diester phosphodiesterase